MNVLSQKNSLPSVQLKTIYGATINANKINGNGNPLVMIFWQTTDPKSCENLKTLYSVYTDSLASKKVKIVAICIDETGSISNILPYIKSNELDLDVYIDVNGEFKRMMGVTVPYTILFDQNMKIYCQQRGYCIGSDKFLCEKINACLKEVSSDQ